MKLFIDSATDYLYLEILDKETSYKFVRCGKNDHSETLTSYLEKFLLENNLNINQIKEVYVGRGPGSYTGVRIAGTVAKVLAHILNLPLYSFSSLDLIACNYLEEKGQHLVKIKAKKNHSYYKAYEKNETLKIVVDDSFNEDSELLKYQDFTIIDLDESFKNPKSKALDIIKYKMYKKEDTFTYVPNYLRSELS